MEELDRSDETHIEDSELWFLRKMLPLLIVNMAASEYELDFALSSDKHSDKKSILR